MFSIILVPGTGLEPAHLAAIPPQGIMSTNFNTRALYINICLAELSQLLER